MVKKLVMAGLVASSVLYAGDFFVGADVGRTKVTIDGTYSADNFFGY